MSTSSDRKTERIAATAPRFTDKLTAALKAAGFTRADLDEMAERPHSLETMLATWRGERPISRTEAEAMLRNSVQIRFNGYRRSHPDWTPDFQGIVLGDHGLQFANLRRANLRLCRLINVDLSFANLAEADLRGAVLIDCNLNNAKLDDASLQNAVIKGYGFTSAGFEATHGKDNAGARRRHLTSASVVGANLWGARVPEEIKRSFLHGAEMAIFSSR